MKKHEMNYQTLKIHKQYSDGQSYPYNVVISFKSDCASERLIEIKDGIQEAMENAANAYLAAQNDVNDVMVTPF